MKREKQETDIKLNNGVNTKKRKNRKHEEREKP